MMASVFGFDDLFGDPPFITRSSGSWAVRIFSSTRAGITTAITSIVLWVRDTFTRSANAFYRASQHGYLDFSLARLPLEQVDDTRPLAAFVSPEPAMVGGGAMFRRWR